MKDNETVDGEALMKYLEQSRELAQFIPESFDSTMLKYQQERKYIHLVFFSPELKIYDSSTYQSYDTLTRSYKNVYATSRLDISEKFISMAVRDALKIKSAPKNVET